VKLAEVYYNKKKEKYGRGNRVFSCLIKRAKKKIICEKRYEKLRKIETLYAKQQRSFCIKMKNA